MHLRKSKKRELDIIAELRLIYGYLFRAAPRSEQTGTLFKAKGKKLVYTPSVNMRLSVPASSAFGRQAAAVYRANDKAIAKAIAKAKAAKKVRR